MSSELYLAFDEFRQRFPHGIAQSEIDKTPLREIFHELTAGVTVDFAPYFPLQNEENILSRTFTLILDLDKERDNYLVVFSNYLFAIYILKKFGVKNV